MSGITDTSKMATKLILNSYVYEEIFTGIVLELEFERES